MDSLYGKAVRFCNIEDFQKHIGSKMRLIATGRKPGVRFDEVDKIKSAHCNCYGGNCRALANIREDLRAFHGSESLC